MSKILVAIDGSEPSHRALEYVAKRRKQNGGFKVIAVHAEPYLTVAEAAELKDQPKSARDVFRNNSIRDLIAALEAETVKAAESDPANAIIACCKQHGCEEIVMGTRGLGNLKGLLIGSVSTRVAQLSEVPVTLVK